MRSTGLVASTAVVLTALAMPPVALGQDVNAAHAHIEHVASAFGNTPDGQGLLPVAQTEAETAASHASYAADSSDDLDAMRRHAAHVLHALNPEAVASGPGLGYGVIPAATGVARHIELAADADGASDNVSTHATHVAASASNTVSRAQRMVQLCNAIAAASSASEAAPLVQELTELGSALTGGVDANGDGRVGWQEGEGGLDQAEQHLGLLMRGEGMDR